MADVVAHDRTWRVWTAYGAALWAALFSLQSLLAAIVVTAGSAAGAEAFGRDIAAMARSGDFEFVVVLWLAVVAKAGVGVAVLASVRRPSRLLAVATWAVGALTLLYGIANLIEHTLMKASAVRVPSGLGEYALAWHVWLWDPYWIVGGLLFLAAAGTTARSTDEPSRHWQVSRRCIEDRVALPTPRGLR